MRFDPATKQLQQAINAAGYTPRLAVDGLLGPKTRAAASWYERYQQRHAAAPATVLGVDVSGHNSKLDWPRLYEAGVRFAIVKATEDDRYSWARHLATCEAARSAGIQVGSYHFGRPDTGAVLRDPEHDAHREADLFLSRADIRPGDLRPVLDLEKGCNEKGSTRARNVELDRYNARWSLAWLRRVQAGIGLPPGRAEWVRPLVYTAKWAIDVYLRAASEELAELATYPLWWCDYQDRAGLPRDSHAPWPSWAIWQYSGHGVLPGGGDRIDLNRATAESLAELTIPGV